MAEGLRKAMADVEETGLADRQAIVEHLREQLKRGDKTLIGNKGYRKYLIEDGRKRFSIDEAKVREEARYDGHWETIEADFHWHLELLPQVFRITGFEWASGFFYNPVPPEIVARCLTPRSEG